MASWEHFSHEADLGVRGRGESLEAAFEQTAMALVGAITNPNRVHGVEEVDIHCRAPTLEILLVDWLNALIYEMSTRSMLFGGFRAHIEGLELTAKAWGEPVDRSRHQPAVEPKGATLTELWVGRDENDQWVAQCVVDV